MGKIERDMVWSDILEDTEPHTEPYDILQTVVILFLEQNDDVTMHISV